VLNDLGAASCNLQQVSWVIPDGSWSDHPGKGSTDAGPSWVAAIVNAVGNSTNFGKQLRPTPCTDTIKGQQVPYWQDTVVLVVWDDWGGFYDDIEPWNCDATGFCSGYPNTTAREYVYGFRVPLLVVGAYVNQVTPQGDTFPAHVRAATAKAKRSLLTSTTSAAS
jgi:phospholipase C